MSYVAHAAIKLANDESPNEKNVWHRIKQCDGIEYRWKFTKEHIYHVIAGVFDDPNDALKCAKQLYVSLFYEVVWQGFPIADAGCSSYETRLFHDGEPEIKGYDGDETFFFWTKHYQGGKLGPGVFEVDKSIDEFDEYQFFDVSLSISHDSDLNFDKADELIFLYCREAQEYFHSITLAENAFEYGMKMTIYCGLLEHLSENRNKEEDVLCVLDELVKCVDSSTLSSEKKDMLKNYLNRGRNVSASQKCRDLCKKYARGKYGEYDCKKIIDKAYSIRSAFSHGERGDNLYSRRASYIKYVALDVIKNYMSDKERSFHV